MVAHDPEQGCGLLVIGGFVVVLILCAVVWLALGGPLS